MYRDIHMGTLSSLDSYHNLADTLQLLSCCACHASDYVEHIADFTPSNARLSVLPPGWQLKS